MSRYHRHLARTRLIQRWRKKRFSYTMSYVNVSGEEIKAGSLVAYDAVKGGIVPAEVGLLEFPAWASQTTTIDWSPRKRIYRAKDSPPGTRWKSVPG